MISGKYITSALGFKSKYLTPTVSIIAGAAILAACGSDRPSGLTGNLSMGQDFAAQQEVISWINNEDTVPLTVSYINSSSINSKPFNVTPMLESAIYQAWVDALKLLRTEIQELDSTAGNVKPGLELKNILLVEKKRLEIDAGGQLTTAPQNNNTSQSNQLNQTTNKTSNPSTKSSNKSTSSTFVPGQNPSFGQKPLVVTNKEGVKIKLYLNGSTSEFSTIVKFIDKRSGKRIDIPLKDSISYWKMGFGTDSQANLDASSLVSMFLKLPPMVANALGTFLKQIGTLEFFLKLKSTQHWIDADADKVNIPGLGRVSKLSYLLARDIFSTVCKLEGFSQDQCYSRIEKWSKSPITDQIKTYAVMPIKNCNKLNRYESTLPLYSHFIEAPKVEETELDFFALDPNREQVKLNLYRKISENNWTKKWGFIGGKYGTYVRKAEDYKCDLEPGSDKRCIEIQFGAHNYEYTCESIAYKQIKNLGYSFYSENRIYTEPSKN